MKRIIRVLLVLGCLWSATGCSNFWTNYYSLEPGLANTQNVRKMLGKPFVKGQGKWIYFPKKNDIQYLELYFDKDGILLAKVRYNPRQEPPPAPDGTIKTKEVFGKVPPFTPGSSTHIETK